MTTPPHIPTAAIQCSNCHTNTAASFTTYTMSHTAVSAVCLHSCHNGSYTSQGTTGAQGLTTPRRTSQRQRLRLQHCHTSTTTFTTVTMNAHGGERHDVRHLPRRHLRQSNMLQAKSQRPPQDHGGLRHCAQHDELPVAVAAPRHAATTPKTTPATTTPRNDRPRPRPPRLARALQRPTTPQQRRRQSWHDTPATTDAVGRQQPRPTTADRNNAAKRPATARPSAPTRWSQAPSITRGPATHARAATAPTPAQPRRPAAHGHGQARVRDPPQGTGRRGPTHDSPMPASPAAAPAATTAVPRSASRRATSRPARLRELSQEHRHFRRRTDEPRRHRRGLRVAAITARPRAGKPATHIPTTAPCETCHKSTVTFAGARMDHSRVTAPCASCHNGGWPRASRPSTSSPICLAKSCHRTGDLDAGDLPARLAALSGSRPGAQTAPAATPRMRKPFHGNSPLFSRIAPAAMPPTIGRSSHLKFQRPVKVYYTVARTSRLHGRLPHLRRQHAANHCHAAHRRAPGRPGRVVMAGAALDRALTGSLLAGGDAARSDSARAQPVLDQALVRCAARRQKGLRDPQGQFQYPHSLCEPFPARSRR